jgi:hypothetical protein
MPRIGRFTFVVSNFERELISQVARELRRSDSDAMRFLVISKAKELNLGDKEPTDHLRQAHVRHSKPC